MQRSSFWPDLRLARRTLLSFWLLSLGGLTALMVTVLSLGRAGNVERMLVSIAACVAGLLLGNVLALFRVRFLPTLAGLCLVLLWAVWILDGGQIRGFSILGAMGLGCGYLALTGSGRFVGTWMSVLGWVGAIMVYLNHHHRVAIWHQSKIAAWMPLPLIGLGLMVLLTLLYFSTDARRLLSLWCGDNSGGVGRRMRQPRVRGVFALLALASLVFAASAALAPYLWRTGSGNHRRRAAKTTPKEAKRLEPQGSCFDAERLARVAARLTRQARRTLPWLLLALTALLARRPLRRWLALLHWRRPCFAVSPSERLANLWRVLLVAAADAGLRRRPADSISSTVEAMQLCLRRRGLSGSPEIKRAAAIYSHSRYGLGLDEQALTELRSATDRGYRQLRAGIGRWRRLRCLWRRDMC